MSTQANIKVSIDKNKILDALYQLNKNELFDIITKIDKCVDDYSFSKKVHDYYSETLKV